MNPSPGHLFRLAIVALFVFAVVARALVGVWQAGSEVEAGALDLEERILATPGPSNTMYEDLVGFFAEESNERVN